MLADDTHGLVGVVEIESREVDAVGSFCPRRDLGVGTAPVFDVDGFFLFREGRGVGVLPRLEQACTVEEGRVVFSCKPGNLEECWGKVCNCAGGARGDSRWHSRASYYQRDVCVFKVWKTLATVAVGSEVVALIGGEDDWMCWYRTDSEYFLHLPYVSSKAFFSSNIATTSFTISSTPWRACKRRRYR